MLVKRSLSSPGLLLLLALLLIAGPTWPQADVVEPGGLDVTFLLNYYDQDGDNSPVTGGIGTEDLQVIAPLFVLGWRINDDWTLRADLGVDSITSASTDAIDDVTSSASRQDARAYTRVTAVRTRGENSLSLIGGLSNEYDYQSASAGFGWSRSFNEKNTSFGARLLGYFDTVKLYDIDGVNQGDSDRTTIDLSMSLSQVLSRRTVASVELTLINQDGFLSTPFHEVLLASTPEFPEGQRITERLPDSRQRQALGLRLNHAFSRRIAQHVFYRFYDDDWGIQAHTLELETHFRLPTEKEMWLFPILRFHTQDGSDYFGAAGTFDGSEAYLTADHDLSEFDAEKAGLGYRLVVAPRRKGWRSLETRLSYYERDNGLTSIQTSWAVGWRF